MGPLPVLTPDPPPPDDSPHVNRTITFAISLGSSISVNARYNPNRTLPSSIPSSVFRRRSSSSSCSSGENSTAYRPSFHLPAEPDLRPPSRLRIADPAQLLDLPRQILELPFRRLPQRALRMHRTMQRSPLRPCVAPLDRAHPLRHRSPSSSSCHRAPPSSRKDMRAWA